MHGISIEGGEERVPFRASGVTTRGRGKAKTCDKCANAIASAAEESIPEFEPLPAGVRKSRGKSAALGV